MLTTCHYCTITLPVLGRSLPIDNRLTPASECVHPKPNGEIL